MSKSKGEGTNKEIKHLRYLYGIRKMKLDPYSVDAPIGNYYIYTLMKESKNGDYINWYFRFNKKVISNGIFELALMILNHVKDKKKRINKVELVYAMEESGLFYNYPILDFRFDSSKVLKDLVEELRAGIYDIP